MTTLKVIIAEDNTSDVELMLHELRKSGFKLQSRVVQTEDEYQSALKEGADVILADYSLPHFNALEALRLLKESSSDIPLIVVTGAVGDEAAAECIKRGASDYLLKDRLTRLGQAVGQAVEKKRLRDGKRRAESALLESEDRFQAIMDSILDAAMIIDLDGTILFANQAAAHLFHLSECDQATGRRLSDFFLSTTRDRLAKDLHAGSRWLRRIPGRIRSPDPARSQPLDRGQLHANSLSRKPRGDPDLPRHHRTPEDGRGPLGEPGALSDPVQPDDEWIRAVRYHVRTKRRSRRFDFSRGQPRLQSHDGNQPRADAG